MIKKVGAREVRANRERGMFLGESRVWVTKLNGNTYGEGGGYGPKAPQSAEKRNVAPEKNTPRVHSKLHVSGEGGGAESSGCAT